MRAEDGIRRILKIRLRIIMRLLPDEFFVVAEVIAVIVQREPARPACILQHLLLIGIQLGCRRAAGQDQLVPKVLRRQEAAREALHIGHSAVCRVRRDFQPEAEPGLQKARFCAHQAHSKRPVRRFPKVAALRMFDVRTAGNQRDPNVRQRTSREHSELLFFRDMLQNQVLEVSGKLIRRKRAPNPDACPARKRIEPKMYLRVMPQRFIMPDALYRILNRFPVQDMAVFN